MFWGSETFSAEAKPNSAPTARQTGSSDNQSAQTAENAAVPDSQTSQKNADGAKTADKKTASANDRSDEDSGPDPAEILGQVRKRYAKKNGFDKLRDDLILSQSSGDIFLKRKKIRDVSDNILDHWYLSSFEDEFNLTRIEFESVAESPLAINLDADVSRRISLNDNVNPILNNSDVTIKQNVYVNFHIPKSVLESMRELDEGSVDISAPAFLLDAFSTSNYFVLSLALLGFSILIYIIYRIVVWAFMLDQNKDYDYQKGRNEEVVAPVNMDAYSAYFYQETPEDKL